MRAIQSFMPRASFSRSLRIIQRAIVTFGFVVTAFCLGATDAAACASCGCTLSNDWDTLQSSPGLKLDLRYDYLNQDQLRSGTHTISPVDAAAQSGGAQEVEKYTKNNYYTLGIDYGFNRDWGVNVQVPYIDRQHRTMGTPGLGWDGVTPGDGAYDSHTRSLGDVRVIGRYQGFTPQCNFGVLYGLKLPTGSYSQTGTMSDGSGAVTIDPGLQPGTGSTDAIVGAFYANGIGHDWDYFTQALYQTAVSWRSGYGYRPGNGFNLNIGLRYAGIAAFAPQVQVNYRNVQRDSGDMADKVSTGGTLAYISPGVSVPLGAGVTAYGFVQLPIYQDLNGVQLAPKYTASLGVRYAF
jgi:hypothetical protein